MALLSIYQTKVVTKLVAAGVECLVIGGRAMQAHGLSRESKDLDLFVSRRRLNAERLKSALAGIMSEKISVKELQLPMKRIQLINGRTSEVDLLTSIGTLDFELAAKRSILAPFGKLELRAIGLNELFYAKLVSATENLGFEAKARDLDDLDTITELWHSRLGEQISKPLRG